MTSENQKLLYEASRDLLTETVKAVYGPLRKMTNSAGGQAEAYREIASSCAPQTHHQTLALYNQKVEFLLEGKISGKSAADLDERSSRVVKALSMLQTASSELTTLLEPYAGFSGTIRAALEIGTRPWSLLTVFARKDPFQEKRATLEREFAAALDEFNDSLMSFLLAVEVVVSTFLEKPFGLSETYETLVKHCNQSAREPT